MNNPRWTDPEKAIVSVLYICKTPNWDDIAAYMHHGNMLLQLSGADMQSDFEIARWTYTGEIRSQTCHWERPAQNLRARDILDNYKAWKTSQVGHGLNLADEFPNDLSAPGGEGHPRRAGVFVRCLRLGCPANQQVVVNRAGFVHPENRPFYDGLTDAEKRDRGI